MLGQNQQTLKHFFKSDLQEMTELVELLWLWDVKTKPKFRILLVNTSCFFSVQVFTCKGAKDLIPFQNIEPVNETQREEINSLKSLKLTVILKVRSQ